MLTTAADVTTNQTAADYVLGYTDSEQERLIRQAAIIAPITERLFREAGIGPGQRVLDLGSGMGDVAMLVARLVGSLGRGGRHRTRRRLDCPRAGARSGGRISQCEVLKHRRQQHRCQPAL